MHRILIGAAALLVAALPARAGQQQPAPNTDVNRGTDDRRPASPDDHAKSQGHWDPKHVEKNERRTARGPQAADVERPRELVEVHEDEADRVAQVVADRLVAAVADRPLVDAAGAHAKASTARCALTTPSSWKPQRQ